MARPNDSVKCMKVCSQLCKSGLLLTHLGWPTGCMALGQAEGKKMKRSTLQSIVDRSITKLHSHSSCHAYLCIWEISILYVWIHKPPPPMMSQAL